jgi:hypothetical protein
MLTRQTILAEPDDVDQVDVDALTGRGQPRELTLLMTPEFATLERGVSLDYIPKGKVGRSR